MALQTVNEHDSAGFRKYFFRRIRDLFPHWLVAGALRPPSASEDAPLSVRHQEPPLDPDDAKRIIAEMMESDDTGRPHSSIT